MVQKIQSLTAFLLMILFAIFTGAGLLACADLLIRLYYFGVSQTHDEINILSRLALICAFLAGNLLIVFPGKRLVVDRLW